MSVNHLEPARTVVEKIGGAESAAEVVGKHVSRIYRWMYPKDRGGTGGFVPPEDAEKLLAHSRSAGGSLVAEDFFHSKSPCHPQGDAA